MQAAPSAVIFRARAWLRVAILATLVFPGAVLSVHAAEPTTAQTPVPLSHPGTLVGRTNPAQAITVAAALKPTDPKALDTFLADLYDPASPTFHHYLTPQSFTQRFFDPATRKQVVSYLQAQGFTVSDPGLGALIDATGTVGQVERAFRAVCRATEPMFLLAGQAIVITDRSSNYENRSRVTLSDYRDANGRVFYTNDVTPALPVAIANLIHGIIGLDNAPVAVPLSPPGHTASASGPSRGAPTRQSVCTGAQDIYDANSQSYLPAQFATAYHLSDLYTQGYHGEGQKIAFLQLSDYHDADPQTYQTCFGTSVPLTRVLVDGGPTGPNQYDREAEPDVDIETVVSLAPNLAGILNYLGPNTLLSTTHVTQKIANDNLASIVSISWGVCEPRHSVFQFLMIAQHIAFEQMAAQGQAVFTAAGDTGSTGCLPAIEGATHQVTATYPSTDLYVTAVGGTHVTIDDATSAWVSETVWNDYPATISAGGGGVSLFWNRFPYQSGPGITNNDPLNPNNARMVPDVTIAGDFQYIYYVSGTWHVVAGTSIGAPFWAAGAALINQYLIAHGKTRLGFANPALYAIFRTPAQYASAFHDITTGNNCVDPASTCGTPPNTAGDLYTAMTGYDIASGIGSPHFGNLAAALLTVPLSPTIAGITPNRGLATGGNPVTITGTNFVAPMGVYFGTNFAPATNVVVVNATTITATVPASNGAFAADVTLTTTAPGLAQITLPGAYTYMPNALPGQQPSGNPSGSPGALPSGRPAGSGPAGAVQPLPPRRP